MNLAVNVELPLTCIGSVSSGWNDFRLLPGLTIFWAGFFSWIVVLPMNNGGGFMNIYRCFLR